MSNAAALRAKAVELHTLAREYAPSVGRPLYAKAVALEREAAELDRNGRERRQAPLTLKQRSAIPPRPVFGRRGLQADS